MSLRAQFFLSVVMALFLSLSLEAAVACWQARRSVENEMTVALEAGDHIVDNALVSLPDSNIDPYLARLVESFNGSRHIKVTLFQAGRARAASAVEPAQPVPGWFMALLEIPVEKRIDIVPRMGNRMIVVTTDPHNEIGEVWGQFRDEEAILSLFSLVMMGLLFVVMARISSSLKTLRAGFDAVGGGDYAARAKARGPRELVHLAQAFNIMAEKLEGIESANRRMSRQLAAIQDEERAELARELHDEMGPLLFAVRVDAESIDGAARTAGHKAIQERAHAIADAVSRMQRHVRLLLKQLRPADFTDFGLEAAIENLASFWRQHYCSLVIDISVADARDGFGVEPDTAIYRLVQEGLSNAVRHSGADHVWITIAADAEQIRVTVEDDGVGPPSDGSIGKGLGLKGMRERLANLSGEMKLGERPGGGMRLAAHIPRRHAPVTAEMA